MSHAIRSYHLGVLRCRVHFKIQFGISLKHEIMYKQISREHVSESIIFAEPAAALIHETIARLSQRRAPLMNSAATNTDGS